MINGDLTLFDGSDIEKMVAEIVTELPVANNTVGRIVYLNTQDGANDPGIYVYTGVSYSYISGDITPPSLWTAITAKILASDGQAGDFFSWQGSISDDGGTIAVSANWEDTGGADAGKAYIFTRSGSSWIERQMLQGSTTTAGDRFGEGASLSGDGNVVAIGASVDDGGKGAVFVFTRATGDVTANAWTEQQRLSPAGLDVNDFFGAKVTISGDGHTILAVADGDDDNGSTAGAVYVFTRAPQGSVWTQEAKILAITRPTDVGFGSWVALSEDGDVAIIGNKSGGMNVTGTTYFFTRSGTVWSEQQMVSASDAESTAKFGFSVDMSADGTVAVVGAYENTDGGITSGSAYVFTESGGVWSEDALISSGNAGDEFGRGVAISGDGTRLAIGAPQHDNVVSNAGAVYTYINSGSWTQDQILVSITPTADDWFGLTTSMSENGTSIMVGSFLSDDNGGNSGAGYVQFAGSGGSLPEQPDGTFPAWVGMETTVANTYNKGFENSNNMFGMAFDATHVYLISDLPHHVYRSTFRDPYRFHSGNSAVLIHNSTTTGGGDHPHGLTIIDNDLVTIKDILSNQIKFINKVTGAVTKTITSAGALVGITYDGTDIITLDNAGLVRLVDPTDGTVLSSFTPDNLASWTDFWGLVWNGTNLVISGKVGGVFTLQVQIGKTAAVVNQYGHGVDVRVHDLAFDGTNLVSIVNTLQGAVFVHDEMNNYTGSQSVEYTGPFNS